MLLAAPIEHHNQRLEFLGDAVVELLASHHLFCLLPEADEGELTDRRSSVVNNKLIARLATRLGLHSFALIGERSASGGLWQHEPESYEKTERTRDPNPRPSRVRHRNAASMTG